MASLIHSATSHEASETPEEEISKSLDISVDEESQGLLRMRQKTHKSMWQLRLDYRKLLFLLLLLSLNILSVFVSVQWTTRQYSCERPDSWSTVVPGFYCKF